MKRYQPAAESWQQKQARLQADFAHYWDWAKVIQSWRNSMEDANLLSPSGLFSVIEVHDPRRPLGREPELSWWPTKTFDRDRSMLQEWYFAHPGTNGPIHPASFLGAGVASTLAVLSQHRESIDLTGATLIAGSLFSRIGSRRGHYPEKWPDRQAVNVLVDWVHQALGWCSWDDGWHPSCTSVLPYESSDWDYRFDDMSALVRYLAEEHIGLLLRHRPVIIQFVEKADPFVERAIVERWKAAEKRREEYALERQRLREEEEKVAAERRALHPRCDDWNALPRDELLRLVWSKPTTDLAKEFGVSDVAIGKRCKASKIMKPPPGFWARVRAGKEPDPQGVPPYGIE